MLIQIFHSSIQDDIITHDEKKLMNTKHDKQKPDDDTHFK